MPAAIPEGYHTLTPNLIVNGAAEAIKLYERAFGAKEQMRALHPKTGKIMHACLQIGSSKVFLADASPDMGCAAPTTSNFYVYLNDVDAGFRQAKEAGLEEKFAPQDMFYGDRVGTLKDRFGNMWTLATHVRDVSKEEMDKAMKEMAASKAA